MPPDRDRIAVRLDDLRGYLAELRPIAPDTLEGYRSNPEKRRACERLLQICIESVLDVCALLVTGFRLGVPGEEDDILRKIAEAGILPDDVVTSMRTMRAFRNLLVHEYGRVNDEIVFRVVRENLGDFDRFGQEVSRALRGGG